ncbi:unnamed protein product [Vitrella brassicaformis CCMP3155]|uniref:Uncharacterized protein n=1 Tax=Vitrella brassicaformis (strain CCMP3155) TaxID=1169540 RepID=A0A0G4EYM9_VITBC|nr:unnamed protein product [Vitrella brassicaformis CCMP3155]|eukprot:CEM03997.1 unnamed protein product [Vitrella brassicaformis CCMP3155]
MSRREDSPCRMKEESEKVMRFLDIPSHLLDSRHDKCFCLKCYSPPTQPYTRGDPPVPYIPPLGWYRRAIKLTDDERRRFGSYVPAYHGTRIGTYKKIVEDRSIRAPKWRASLADVWERGWMAMGHTGYSFCSPLVEGSETGFAERFVGRVTEEWTSNVPGGNIPYGILVRACEAPNPYAGMFSGMHAPLALAPTQQQQRQGSADHRQGGGSGEGLATSAAEAAAPAADDRVAPRAATKRDSRAAAAAAGGDDDQDGGESDTGSTDTLDSLQLLEMLRKVKRRRPDRVVVSGPG